MGPKDVEILMLMKDAMSMSLSVGKDYLDLAERLLLLRDMLEFKDHGWYHELTQHIVTIDSLGSWTPSSHEEVMKFLETRDSAISTIQRLIHQRLTAN